jgi:hypothetical protein
MQTIDGIVILFFQILHPGTAAFVLGCSILALFAVLVGQISALVVRRINRNWYRRQYEDMVRMHNLSVQALEHSDKEAYVAANKQATEACGKYFFSQVGVFLVSLWPVPAILAWMDIRFRLAPVELGPWEIPYFATFLVIYIGLRMMLGPLWAAWPLWRRLSAWADHRHGIVARSFEDIGT